MQKPIPRYFSPAEKKLARQKLVFIIHHLLLLNGNNHPNGLVVEAGSSYVQWAEATRPFSAEAIDGLIDAVRKVRERQAKKT